LTTNWGGDRHVKLAEATLERSDLADLLIQLVREEFGIVLEDIEQPSISLNVGAIGAQPLLPNESAGPVKTSR
jgi:hypothetical protein